MEGKWLKDSHLCLWYHQWYLCSSRAQPCPWSSFRWSCWCLSAPTLCLVWQVLAKILLFRGIDIFNSNGKTIYLNHTWYLHGPMVPGRVWREGQCWVPWSGSSLLHNWSCGPRGHWTRPRQPPHLCCAPPQLSRAFISTIDCGSGSGSGYYHSSTPADYCMTGAGHRLLSPFTLNPAY